MFAQNERFFCKSILWNLRRGILFVDFPSSCSSNLALHTLWCKQAYKRSQSWNMKLFATTLPKNRTIKFCRFLKTILVVATCWSLIFTCLSSSSQQKKISSEKKPHYESSKVNALCRWTEPGHSTSLSESYKLLHNNSMAGHHT